MDENMEPKTNENVGKVENTETTNSTEQNAGYNEEVRQVLNSTATEQTQQTSAQASSTANKSVNACGLISFIFSMIGIFMFGLPCGIVATILGIIGVANFKPETQTARWMAITGLAVGVVEVVIMGLYIAVV